MEFSQEIATRYLRRRLWKAFQEDNAQDALRVYTATRTDYETMVAEDNMAEQTRQAQEKQRLEARPVSMRKFGALLRSTSGGIRSKGGSSKSRIAQERRSRSGTNDSGASAVELSAESSTNRSTDSTTCLLQETMNPSELFVPDDLKDPSASYEPDELPIQESEQEHKNAKQPRTANRARLSFQLFSSRRSARMEDEEADEDSSVESEAEEPESTTTPLHEAARIGSAALVRLMLAHDGRPNFRNGKLRTVLHMAVGGLTKIEEEQMKAWRIEQGLADIGDDEILDEDVGIRAPIVESEEDDVPLEAAKTTAKKAAQAVGRFFKQKRRRPTAEGNETESAPVVIPKLNESLVKAMEAERMDAVLAIMSWNHPEDGSSSAGEGASVNTVDSRDRTALHYAAELGRTDICLTLTSSFGTMLTVVDESSRTPCELAAEQSYEELAAELEARALLFVDPYGMDDELMASVLAGDALSRNLGSEECDPSSGRTWRHWRKKLAEPFSLFATWTPEEVQEEREARIFRTLDSMQSIIAQLEGAKAHSDLPLGGSADVDQDYVAPVRDNQASADVDNEAVNESDEDGGTETALVPDKDPTASTEKTADTVQLVKNAVADAEAKDEVASCEVGLASNVSASVEDNEAQVENEATSDAAEPPSNIATGIDNDEIQVSAGVDNIEAQAESEVASAAAEPLSNIATSNNNEAQAESELVSAAAEPLSNIAALVDDETAVDASSDFENTKAASEVEKHVGTVAMENEEVDIVAQDGPNPVIQGDMSEVIPKEKPEATIDVSCLQACLAEKLLLHHGFDVDAAIKSFRSDPRGSMDEAGLTLLEYNADDEPTSEGPTKSCLICCEEFESSSPGWRDLKCCKHGFCLTCLGDYVQQSSVTRELGVCIYCPHHACRSLLSPQELSDLAPNVEIYDALIKAANENFVTAAGDMRFCPHPGCPGIVKRLLPAVVKNADIAPMFVGMMGAVCTSCDIDDDENIPMTHDGMRDFNYTSLSRDALQPRRAHRFCFACGVHEPHWPATCELMESWKAKVQEEVSLVGEGKVGSYQDVAQQLWLRTNTRPCPKCEAPIEKVEGCNHMTCKNRHCKYEFCWICRQDWKLHNTATGGFFRCNKWQEEKDHEFYSEKPPPTTGQGNEDDDDPASQATRYGTAMHSNLTTQRNKYKLERFLHHYRRWNAHAESAALERRMADTVCARLTPVIAAARDFQGDGEFDFGGRGLSFVHAAFTELLECRSVLGHSYIFAYFRYPPLLYIRRRRPVKFRQREKLVFEQFQADLEIVTEHLSDIVARAHLRATQTQIMFLTSGAAEKRRDFSNLMLTILHDEKREQDYARANDRPVLSVSDDDDGPYESMMRGATKKMLVLELFPETAMRAGLDLPVEPFGDGADVYDELERAVRNSLNLGEPEHQQAPHPLDPAYRWSQWSCPACTYVNIGGSRCAMCDTPRE